MLDPKTIERFNLKNPSPNSGKSKGVVLAANNYQGLELDAFLAISDWYHYAILELMKVNEASLNPKWISKRLGITVIEAKTAVQRLIDLNMIQVDANAKLKELPKAHTTVQHQYSNSAFRKLQKQILLQAINALEEVPFEVRDQSSLTMAIDPALIPEAKEKIKKFRRELCAFLQTNDQNLTEVYQLSISLFPANRGRNNLSDEGEKS